MVEWLNYCMEQSPSWEANRFLASQEIPRISCSPKVHYRSHKYPPPVAILSQIDPAHVATSHFLKIHLNIILSSTPGSSKVVSFSQVSPPKPCIHLYSLPIHATFPANLILLDLITRKILGEEYISVRSSLCSFLHSPFTSFLLRCVHTCYVTR